MNKAVFLDRDGVINELIYHTEAGIIDNPFTVSQFKLLSGVPTAVTRFHQLGFLVVLVSNQPGLAKGHLDEKTFAAIREKMQAELAAGGAYLDAEYYCLHHPEASIARYKEVCACRKPKPGLLRQAAADHDIDLPQSWIIGDSLTDIQAGRATGVRTMLVGKMKCDLCKMMDETDARPDFIVAGLPDAVGILRQSPAPDGMSILCYPQESFR
jgi:D-glycero-D-manno-heptose 1,7-bisphosphate phosphatase